MREEAKTSEDRLSSRPAFASRDVKLYTGEQILATFEIYKQQRNLADRVVGVVSDIEGRDLYLEYRKRVDPRDGCGSQMRIVLSRPFVRSPTATTPSYALRLGADTETDYHVS